MSEGAVLNGSEQQKWTEILNFIALFLNLQKNAVQEWNIIYLLSFVRLCLKGGIYTESKELKQLYTRDLGGYFNM